MTQLFARFGGMGFAELREVDPREFRNFAAQFSDVVRSLPFQLPDNFLLIIRATSLISGVASSLDPQFNLWNSVEPYASKLIRDERGNIVQEVAKQALNVAGVTVGLPRRLDGLITKFEDGSVSVATPRLDRQVSRLDRSVRGLVSALLFGGLLVGGVILRADDAVLGTVLMVLSVVPLLQALFSGRRSP